MVLLPRLRPSNERWEVEDDVWRLRELSLAVEEEEDEEEEEYGE